MADFFGSEDGAVCFRPSFRTWWAAPKMEPYAFALVFARGGPKMEQYCIVALWVILRWPFPLDVIIYVSLSTSLDLFFQWCGVHFLFVCVGIQSVARPGVLEYIRYRWLAPILRRRTCQLHSSAASPDEYVALVFCSSCRLFIVSPSSLQARACRRAAAEAAHQKCAADEASASFFLSFLICQNVQVLPRWLAPAFGCSGSSCAQVARPCIRCSGSSCAQPARP